MQFEYEIGAEEYAAGQLLYHRLSRDRTRLRWVVYSILTALLCVGIAWSEPRFDWGEFLLLLIGAWWLYVGVSNLLPALLLSRHFRRAYQGSELAGQKFKAGVDEGGFEVTGELCSWRVRWPAVRIKAENDKVFMLHSLGTIFIFGKRFLSAEQQQQLRTLSGVGGKS